MNKYISLTLCLLSTAVYGQNDYRKAFQFAEKQTDLMLSEIAHGTSTKPNPVSPRTLDSQGNLVLIPSKDWVSGFFRENYGIFTSIRITVNGGLQLSNTPPK